MKKNFQDFLTENFSVEEIAQINTEAEAESNAILRAQELATQFITSLMDEQKI